MRYFDWLARLTNFKLRYIRKSFHNGPFRLLDVGAGNHSAGKMAARFPNCEYYGLDISRDYNNDERDFQAMKGFFELDLTKLDFSSIPDRYFDGIWMTHVIEHLYNGEEVLPLLLDKLKPGGYFYIEFPGARSLHLPSMKGTLNFNDDPTHVKVYSVPQLKNIFEGNECKVLACGTRRNWWYILGMPVRALISVVRRGHIEGNVYWDILGFAEFLWVRKE